MAACSARYRAARAACASGRSGARKRAVAGELLLDLQGLGLLLECRCLIFLLPARKLPPPAPTARRAPAAPALRRGARRSLPHGRGLRRERLGAHHHIQRVLAALGTLQPGLQRVSELPCATEPVVGIPRHRTLAGGDEQGRKHGLSGSAAGPRMAAVSGASWSRSVGAQRPRRSITDLLENASGV